MTSAAALAEFIAAQADAWTAGDIDAIADAMGLPQMIAGEAGTTFLEDDGQLVEWIEARLARWHARGVTAATVATESIEELPDDAARVTSRWTLAAADGDVRLSFAAVDTLACDEGEWYYVVTDVAGEDAAAAGVS